MKQIYTLTNDYLFKKIFMKEKYLKLLLLDLFGVKANKIKYLNPELIKNNKVGKAGIVDILLEVNDEIVILELQNIDEHNFRERLLFYSSNVISNHCLKEGESYSNLRSIKVYAIINYKLFDDNYHDSVYLKRKNKIFSQKLEYKIFDLTKIDENDKKGKYYEIINLFKNNNLEKLKEIIENEEYREILEKMEIYNKIEKEYQKMEDIYKMMMNEKLDYVSIYKGGVDAGFNQGKALGISQGITQGEKNKTIDIAKNLLKQKVDINTIASTTNL